MLVLKASADGVSKQTFPVYADCDVLKGLEKLTTKDGHEPIIDSAQDDDVMSDEEVVKTGIETSYRDLVIVKDYLSRYRPEQIRRALRTWKLWSPLWNGKLPYD